MNGVEETMELSVVSKPSEKNNDLRVVDIQNGDKYDSKFIKSNFLMYVESFVKEEFSFSLSQNLFHIRGDYRVQSEEHPLYGMEFVQIHLKHNDEEYFPKSHHNFIMDRVNEELYRLKPNFFWRLVRGRSIDIFNNTMVDRDGNVRTEEDK